MNDQIKDSGESNELPDQKSPDIQQVGEPDQNETKKDEIGMTGQEMPRYKSHKTVWALKIKSIAFDSDKARETNRETDGSAIITPEEEGYAPFKVDSAYLRKHNPQVGGYYVVYDGGYKSWSPADVFIDGYTRTN